MRRLDAGAGVAAAGGLLLLVSLFLDWYGPYSAWTIFEAVDLVLAAIGLLAVAAFLRRSGIESRLPDIPLLALGVAAIVLVVSQLVNHPPAAIELDAGDGAWLGLAGAALLLAGALMSVARISLAVSVEHREAPRREASAPPPDPPPTGAGTGRAAEDETVKLTDPDRPA